ncbi:hypothetical protein [uncultured Flavobacterium sp.]|uniref:hypothetical protein n=1 Tax=uncultured Flavobacterium sp. TaxID=165435 RepID=UPI0025D5048C|nr:hypothetical protein [uncultured Flavobacterium sp.]
MKPKYKKYKIKEGDSLESISKILGKPTLEVKNFHNIFCDHDNFIVLDFPKDLKELFIYPEYNEVDLYVIPEVFFNAGNKLLFIPIQQKINYGVEYKVVKGEEINTMKFETSIYFKGKIDNQKSVFEVDRISKTFINNEETSTIADELAEKVASVIYPLQIIVDEEGKWDSVYNFNEINNRWEKVKEKILGEYEGEWVEKYLDLNEKTLQSEEKLNEALSKDWFLNAYFNGIYVHYTKYLSKRNVAFPLLINCKAPVYATEQKIEKYIDDYKLINIEQQGILNDERAKADFEENLDYQYHAMLNPEAEKATGNFRAKYFLDSKTNLVESMFFECSIDLEIPRKVEIVISII